MPDTKVWAQRNTGHSGGFWFEKIVNDRDGFLAVAEPLNPRHGDLVTAGCGRSPTQFLRDEMERGHYRSVGIIKPADPEVLNFCQEHGRVVQIVRHPIAVIGWKEPSYWAKVQSGHLPLHLSGHMKMMAKVIGRPVATRKDHFEAFCRSMASRVYGDFIGNKERWFLARLEDLNGSLASDGSYFATFMSWMTQVSWGDADTNRVRTHFPANKDGDESETAFVWDEERNGPGLKWSHDPTPWRVWKSWERWQQDSFTDAFLMVMAELKYPWPA